jgi:hypothetical protein
MELSICPGSTLGTNLDSRGYQDVQAFASDLRGNGPHRQEPCGGVRRHGPRCVPKANQKLAGGRLRGLKTKSTPTSRTSSALIAARIRSARRVGVRDDKKGGSRRQPATRPTKLTLRSNVTPRSGPDSSENPHRGLLNSGLIDHAAELSARAEAGSARHTRARTPTTVSAPPGNLLRQSRIERLISRAPGDFADAVGAESLAHERRAHGPTVRAQSGHGEAPQPTSRRQLRNYALPAGQALRRRSDPG